MKKLTPKPVYKSKTNLFGASLAALGLAILALPEFKILVETVPVEYQAAFLFAHSITIVVLRQFTDSPTSLTLTRPYTEEDSGPTVAPADNDD
jgi:hypothetical protein